MGRACLSRFRAAKVKWRLTVVSVGLRRGILRLVRLPAAGSVSLGCRRVPPERRGSAPVGRSVTVYGPRICGGVVAAVAVPSLALIPCGAAPHRFNVDDLASFARQSLLKDSRTAGYFALLFMLSSLQIVLDS